MAEVFKPKVSYDVVFLGITPNVGETRDWKNEDGVPLGKGTVIYAGTNAGGICFSRNKENCAKCTEKLCKAPLR